MKLVKKIIVGLLSAYLVLELICFILLKTTFSTAHFPTFKNTNTASFESHIAELSPHWGMWHYPNQTIERKINCLQFSVHTNSYGARDIERIKLADSNRLIFLGDSYIEGWGMNENARLSNLAEVALKKEVMNFSCGWLTPTQEYLVYKDLAKDFSHNSIVWSILPFNDLDGDDSSYHEADKYVHYQPFFEGTYPNYQLLYREDSLSKSTFNRENFAKAPQLSGKQKFNNFLTEFSCWFNIYRAVKTNNNFSAFSRSGGSGYYTYKQAELNKLFFLIKKMKTEAAGKNIILLTLPVKDDFAAYQKNKVVPLKNSLDSLCRSEGITYIDMLTELEAKEKDAAKLYFDCDGHWNEYANKLASEILIPVLRKK